MQTGFANDNIGTDDDDGDAPLQFVIPKPTYSSVEVSSELKRLAALRNCLSESLLDVAHSGSLNSSKTDATTSSSGDEILLSENHMISLKDSREYHATLLEFEKQGFPSDILNEDENNGICLTWRGAYNLMPPKSQQETHYTLSWDRACTMWNIASLELQLASIQNLQSKEGCKISISNCQSSATILNMLRDLISSTTGYDDTTYSTVDLSKSMLNFWECMCLVQGQVCIYKMANLSDDSSPPRQHTTLAYLCNGCVSLYNDGLKYSQDPRLVSELPKESKLWSIHCKIHSMIYTTRTQFHLAIHNRLNQEYGIELARLKKCLQYMKECIDFIKSNSSNSGSGGTSDGSTSSSSSTTTSISKMLLSECETLHRLIHNRLHKANDDNLNIYQEKIPLSLPEDDVVAGSGENSGESTNNNIPCKILMKRNQQVLPEPMLYPQVKLFTKFK